MLSSATATARFCTAEDVSLPDIPPGRNQLQIDFVALRFGPGEVLRYEYNLGNAGAGWSALSERRSVTYAGLTPGRYTFSVRAVNSDGTASSSLATVSFRILPPLWLRWWFLSIAGASLLLLAQKAARITDNAVDAVVGQTVGHGVGRDGQPLGAAVGRGGQQP